MSDYHKQCRQAVYYPKCAVLFLFVFSLCLNEMSAANMTWTDTGGGNWNDNGNWSGNAPEDGDKAYIYGAITSNSTITLTTNETVGELYFNNANNVTIAPNAAQTFTIDDNHGSSVNPFETEAGSTGHLRVTAKMILRNPVAYTNNGGSLTISNGLDTRGNDFYFDGTGDITFDGDVTDDGSDGDGSARMIHQGSGKVSISSDSAHTDVTVINGGGTLEMLHRDALGDTGSDTNTTIDSGSTLSFNFSTATFNNEDLWIAGNGDGGIGALNMANVSGDNTITMVDDITMTANAEIQIDHSTDNINHSGTLSGAHKLTKDGDGLLILSTANTYSGGTRIKDGALRIAHIDGLGATAGTTTTVESGGSLRFNFATNTLDENLVIAGTGHSDTGAVRMNDVTGSNTTTLSGSITLDGDAQINVNGADDTMTHTGTLGENAKYGIHKKGAGILGLTGTLSYTGDTIVSEGTLARTGTWVIADASGSTQSTTVETGAAMTVSSETYVGDDGTGTLTVTGSGSTFTGSTHINVGTNSGSVGQLTLSNSATLTASDRLYVGENAGSLGTVSILSGADAVTTGFTYVAQSGTGTMVVTGNGSTYTGADDVFVSAANGSEGQLTLLDSATFTASDKLYLANDAGSLGTVSIAGGADAITNGASYLGNNGTGTMVISGDGSTYTGVDHVYIGNGNGSKGQLTLSDTATFTASSRLYLGNAEGSLGTISITTGADAIVSNNSYVGFDGTGTMVVSGNGSTYTGLNQIHVGTTDDGVGLLTLSNSATLTASNRLYVGTDAGAQGTVSIASGADAVTSSQTYLGNNGTGTIVVSGNGSTYTGSDHIYVGVGSTGVGTLALSNSAAVTASKDLVIGDTAGSNGILTIESGGDVNVSWTTYVGKAGTGSLTLTGAGSSLDSTGDIIVGNSSGGTGTLTITSAATIETDAKLKIGIAGASGGVGTVTLGSSNGIVNNTDVELGGGTLNTGGYDQGTGGMQNLTMTEDSILDMGDIDSIINFFTIDENTWTGTLSIYDWTGTKATAGGTDQILFDDITGFNLISQIWFYSDDGTTKLAESGKFIDLGNGFYELVPAPEPSTWLGISLLIFFAVWRERKRILNLAHRSSAE